MECSFNKRSIQFTRAYVFFCRRKTYQTGILSLLSNNRRGTVCFKSKILFLNTVNRYALLKKKVYCQFDEFSQNNLFNQIVKYTLNSLIKNMLFDEEIRQNIKKQIIYFSSIDEVEPNKTNLNKLKFNKNNFIYKLLISLAFMIYDNTGVNEEKGKAIFKDFYREEHMQKVYEFFLLNFYKIHLDKSIYHVYALKINWDIDESAVERWCDAFDVEEKITDQRTDIIIENTQKKFNLSWMLNTIKMHLFRRIKNRV